ncbi:rhomboid family intramembrane serine protease [Natrialba swarupiae]|uniref:Rhomboid family intramembrane serine protease n=1 Tax=Natrialba swarupiae TaxID=2448032 RepID=A0A5D5APD4_9EURY|nr:rhomboid family intramembrane serine protease [Natrialba swarupiae]TYT62883.1 rhomboid family intramembrane serine protease [Natrialba swarupiae]
MALPYVPVVAFAVVAVSGLFEYTDTRAIHLFGATEGLWVVLNPFYYVTNMFLHLDWSHFRTNMLLWMPFAILLTWMTSNRHVLGLVVGTNVLTSLVLAIGGMAVWGLSGAVFAVVAATLVRATGYAMRGVSRDTLIATLVGVLFPTTFALLAIMVLAGRQTHISHVGHLLGFAFAGVIESVFVVASRQNR